MEETGKDNKSYNGAQRASPRFTAELAHDRTRPTETGVLHYPTTETEVLPVSETEQTGVLRDDKGRFLQGTAPGPGRWPHGRRDALRVLDTLLSDSGNLAKLRAGLQERLDADPAAFWRAFIVPLLPKELSIGGDGDGLSLTAAVLSVRQALGMPSNGGNGGGGGV